MNARALPAHQTFVVKDTDRIRLKATRTNDDTLHLNYEDPSTGASVLQGRIAISEQTSELDFFDPEFWTVVVRGEVRPTGELDDLPNEPMSFRVEAEDRRLMIERKTMTL